jgi:hypothetical protein
MAIAVLFDFRRQDCKLNHCGHSSPSRSAWPWASSSDLMCKQLDGILMGLARRLNGS